VATRKSGGSARGRNSQQAEEISVVTPRFRLVLGTVLFLTVTLLAVDVILVLALSNPNAQARSLMDLCSRLVTIGFGAIIGLLGGKAT
jgi:hypothetical protein